ncbi:MAG: LamG-like jellyroll fold domain-containing protein [Verrucomicrobiota bacterium]
MPQSSCFCRRIALITAFSAFPFLSHAEILSPPDVIGNSPEYSAAYAAVNVFDNNSTDYASLGGGLNTFLEFQFPSARTFDRIVVLNRDTAAGGDWIGDFTLTLDDGPTRSVARTARRGTSAAHSLGSPATATKVRLDVDALGTGGAAATNTGAMEIFFLKTPAGSAIVDSVGILGSATPFNADYAASNAVDGQIGRSGAAGVTPEYASKSLGAEAYVDFDLGAVLPVTGFDWFDRPTAADRVTAFDMIFSQNAVFGDGDDVPMSFDNSAPAMALSGTFAAVNARYVRYDVTSKSGPATANTGLSEIIFYKSGAAAAVPPQVAVPPAPATRFAQESHTFTVSATGSAPLSYVWNKGGVPIPDQTGASLTLTNLTAADAADYSVTVSNAAGTILSAAAHLTVDTSPGDPARGRTIWLKFDETTGLTAADAAGNDHPGALQNFTGDPSPWQPGHLNNAVSFNPNGPEGNVVTVEDPGTLDFATTGIFSASCWVKAPLGLAQTGGAAILCKGPGAGGEQFCLDLFGGGYRFYMRNDAIPSVATLIGTTIPPNGEWQHLAIVFDRGQNRMQLYVNGEVAGSALPTPTTLSNAEPISIGSRQSANAAGSAYDLNFQGLIDDVSFYSRALSPADIQSISPYIKTPPLAGKAFGGGTHTLTVRGAGAGPITYEWRKNGAVIPNETADSLVLANIGAADTADYSVTLTNPAGSITTTPVRLTVEAAAPDLTRGLLAHLKFDETAGLAAADASGKNNAGTLENFAGDNSQWQAGKIGGAVSVSGSDPNSMEVVNIPDTGGLDFTVKGAFTASCWVKAAPGAVQENGAGILAKGGGGGGEEFCIDLQPAGYRFYLWNGGNPNTPTVLQTNVVPSGEWQCVTAVFNLAGKRMKLYVDGVEAGSAVPPATMLFNADPVSIGSRTASTTSLDYTLNFQGLIDDVHLYDRDLSPQEITMLATPPAVVDAPPLTITRNGGNVEISWPAGVTGWILEESPSLQALSWTASTGVAGNRLVIPAPAGRKFYRLRQ